jgi:hypothetical protein
VTKFKVMESGCHEWTASRSPEGYGRFYLNGRPNQAHRVSYELFVGPIPEGLELDHLCRNRACVNPEHLEPVTRAENNARGESVSKYHALKTHCPKGHPYELVGVQYRKDGATKGPQRRCKPCTYASNEASRKRARARRAA